MGILIPWLTITESSSSTHIATPTSLHQTFPPTDDARWTACQCISSSTALRVSWWRKTSIKINTLLQSRMHNYLRPNILVLLFANRARWWRKSWIIRPFLWRMLLSISQYINVCHFGGGIPLLLDLFHGVWCIDLDTALCDDFLCLCVWLIYLPCS